MEFRNGKNNDSEDDDKLDTTDARHAYVKRTAAAVEVDKFKQRRREVKCAIHLRQRVEPYVDGSQDEAEYIALCQAEAANITKGVFGDVYCCAIGYTLELEAEEFLGYHKSFLGVGGHTASVKKKAHAINNDIKLVGASFCAARAGRQAYQEVENIQKEARNAMATKMGNVGRNTAKAHGTGAYGEGNSSTSSSKGGNDEIKMDADKTKEAAERIEASLPAFLELAWAINCRDISRTLKQVCQKLFLDASVPLERRLRRAEGVKILGNEFAAIGNATVMTKSKGIDAKEIKTRAEIAAMATLAKAQGQELSENDAEELIKQAKAMAAMQAQQQDVTANGAGPPVIL